MRATAYMLFAVRATAVRSFPVPREYQRIHDDLYGFLAKARDKADVETTHRSYTMCQGVFQVFRRRLELKDAIRFSNVLPAGIRCLFVAEWDVDQRIVPFSSRAQMTKEVQSLRSSHNFAPESSIEDVAWALRQSLNTEEHFDKFLESLNNEAAEDFWKVPQQQ